MERPEWRIQQEQDIETVKNVANKVELMLASIALKDVIDE
jgi:hypothetical protein